MRRPRLTLPAWSSARSSTPSRKSWLPGMLVATTGALGEGGDPVRAGQHEGVAVGDVVGQIDAPVDTEGARDVADGMRCRGAPIGTPAQIEDPHPGSPDLLRQPLGRGQDLWAGQAV